jgi:predicted ATPase
MLTHITLEGFRGFRRFDAALGPVTAFLGPNSSGKTTALHAVRLACELLALALESSFPLRVERADPADWEKEGEAEDWIVVTRDTILTGQTLLPLADWRALFVDQEVGKGVKFWIELSFSTDDVIERLWVEVGCAQHQQLKLEVQVLSREALRGVEGLAKSSPLINQRLKELLAAKAPVAVLVPPFYGTVPNEEYRAAVVINRLLGSGDQSHVVRNLVSALDFDQFTHLNTFLQRTLGVMLSAEPKLAYRTTGDKLQTESPLIVRFQDTNGELELSAAGAGLVNLIALFCALSRWRSAASLRPVIFLLDEPEAHLHPRLQAEAAARLSELVVAEFRAQLLLATHSVDILNRLGAEGAALLRCDRAATPSAVALNDDAQLYGDLRSWADLTPYTAINFLASRRVLFCEGKGDREVLERLGRLRYRNDPDGLRRLQRWSMVQLDGASNAPIAPLLARLVRNELVQAQAREGGFEVVTVLDRDYARTPGLDETTDAGVTELSLVWSAHSVESVLLTPPILLAWIDGWFRTWRTKDVARRAAVTLPDDLSLRVEQALAAANADATLNQHAADQLVARLIAQPMNDETGRPITGDQKVNHALKQARSRVAAEPHIWQRGKDRASFVLNTLREGLAQPALKNQLPTDLIKLLRQTDPKLVLSATQGIPAELLALFERLTRP